MDANNSSPTNERSKAGRPSWQETLTAINNLLIPVQEAVIIIRNNPSYDTLVSALSLSFGLKKIGRKVHVISPTPLNLEIIAKEAPNKNDLESLPGLDQITSSLPKKQLRIVMDYNTGSFGKAAMKKESSGLLLNLAPDVNSQPIEPLNIAIQDLETKPNIIFTIEVENIFHLGDFYTQNESFFKKVPIVNVDYHSNNSYFGTANLIDGKASSMSEMIALMLYDLRFVLDAEMAKTLYSGIKSKTQNFSPTMFSANMLEATSICLRYQQKLPPAVSPQV